VEVFVGADGMALEGFTQGATGWVAASAWLLPKECQKLMEAAQAKDWAHAVQVWNVLAKPLGLIESSRSAERRVGQAGKQASSPEMAHHHDPRCDVLL